MMSAVIDSGNTSLVRPRRIVADNAPEQPSHSSTVEVLSDGRNHGLGPALGMGFHELTDCDAVLVLGDVGLRGQLGPRSADLTPAWDFDR